jgi:hypothetical protein
MVREWGAEESFWGQGAGSNRTLHKLLEGEPYELYCTLTIVQVIQPSRECWMDRWHVWGRRSVTHREFWWEKRSVSYQMESLGVGGMIIFKYILKKWVWTLWAGSLWLRYVAVAIGKGRLGSIKFVEFLK